MNTENREKPIADAEAMNRILARLSHEIIEQHTTGGPVCLVGIKRRGVPIAERIRKNIEKFSDIPVSVGELDITLYRDDLTEKFREPHLNSTVIPFDVAGSDIVLVDDVLFTGRTTRAAMDAIMGLGRPAKIRLLVLVDRGHRELPISANYVGKNIPTSKSEFVSVKVSEIDGVDSISICKRE